VYTCSSIGVTSTVAALAKAGRRCGRPCRMEVWHQLCVLDTASAAYGVQNTGQRDVHCIQCTGGTAQPLTRSGPLSTIQPFPRPLPRAVERCRTGPYASWHADGRVWSHVPIRTKRSGRTATAASLLEFLWLPSRRGGLARPLWSRRIRAYAKCATTGRF
jgi:hypothetical protein